MIVILQLAKSSGKVALESEYVISVKQDYANSTTCDVVSYDGRTHTVKGDVDSVVERLWGVKA